MSQTMSRALRSCSSAVPARSLLPSRCRNRLAVMARGTTRSANVDVLPSTASYSSLTRLPLISRISALVEHQSMVQKWELLGARSAMLGISFTLLIELGGGRVVELTREQGELFAATVLLVVSAAGSLAFMRRRGGLGGRLLLEGVLSSLTCVGRSASSFTSTTPSGLDANVDLVVDAAFDQQMTEWLKTSIDEQVQ